ncbi:MAG: hypothetical protein RIE08_08795 [Acidimicrobiales bacterium]
MDDEFALAGTGVDRRHGLPDEPPQPLVSLAFPQTDPQLRLMVEVDHVALTPERA